jgi:epoxyqueuosine reductase
MTAKRRSPARASAGVQETLSGLNVDIKGVARLKDLKGTGLEKAALKLLPSTRSIVVMGMGIYPEFLDLTSPGREAGSANLNQLFTRHIEYLRGRMNRAAYDIAQASHQAGLKALPLPGYGPAVDGRSLEAVISYKHAAEAAGLGQIGMSSLLVTAEYGPRVSLTICLTEASLKSTARDTFGTCRYCNICVFNCPARALARPQKDEPYAINKFACRTYLEATGGCSECMRVCPVASPRYD